MNKITLQEAAKRVGLTPPEFFKVLIWYSAKNEIEVIDVDLMVDEASILLTLYIFNKHKSELASKEKIIAGQTNNLIKLQKKPCVYLLLKDNEIVYVGKSKNIFNRLSEHVDNKVYDSIFMDYMDEKDLYLKELIYINRYRPIHNLIGKNLSVIIKSIMQEYPFESNPVEEMYNDDTLERWYFNPITNHP